jgi:hypothetical protein
MGACCFKPSVSEDVVESSAANSGTGDRGRRANRRGEGATRGVTSDGQLTTPDYLPFASPEIFCFNHTHVRIRSFSNREIYHVSDFSRPIAYVCMRVCV